MLNRIMLRCNNFLIRGKRLKNFSEYRRYQREETEQVKFCVDWRVASRFKITYFILWIEAIISLEPILTMLLVPVLYFKTLMELPAFNEYGLLHLMKINTDFGMYCIELISLNAFKSIIFVSALIMLIKVFYGGIFEWVAVLGKPRREVKVIKAKGNKELSEVLIGSKLVKIEVVNDNLSVIGLELKWDDDSLVLKKI